MTSNRTTAAEVIGRVLRSGAYSNILLEQRTKDLPARDRRAIRSLVYGALRMLPRSDRAIAAASSRPLGRIQPEVLDVLRVGAAELLAGESDRYAAVSEAVEAVRARGKPEAAGFVNAILRRIAATGEPDLEEAAPADRYGVSRWIWEGLNETWGAEAAEAFIAASLTPAPFTIRIRPGADRTIGTRIPDIAGVRSIAGDERPAALSMIDAGSAVVMDAASVAVVNAVAAAPGMTVLDVAAAPGGKTSGMWDAMGGSGTLVAADRHRARTRRMQDRLRRLHIEPHFVIADATAPPFAAAAFDRVLLDAPCTGLGTWRRRPEIPLRLESGDPSRLGRLQRKMIEACLRLVRPGGKLVYSVCTVFPVETIEVIDGLDARPPDALPGRPWGNGLLLAPHLTDTDGMFIAEIRR